jgi:hypothetical protein
VGVIVSKIEADFVITTAVKQNYELYIGIGTPGHGAAYTVRYRVYSYFEGGQWKYGRDWQYGVPGMGSPLTIGSAGDGVASVELTENGQDVDYAIVCPAGTVTGTVADGTLASLNEASVAIHNTLYANDQSAGHYGYVDVTHGIITAYPWDNDDELVDWDDSETWYTSGGYLFASDWSWSTIYQSFTHQDPVHGLTALLSPPAIQRVVASQGTGQLQDRYASGALADILTGSLVDDHPELLHLGAGAHHLGLVWQRGDDIAMTTGTGVPGIGGWPQTVQTVALDRSHPTACVIDPTLDAYMAYLQSGSIALGCPASWSNGSFAMGTETIISSGDVATERGQLLWTPQAKLLYVYRDTSGAVVIRESADRGKSWA